MTKLDIIEETVNYYSIDISRRSINNKGVCMYNSPNGNHCAIGRCLLKKYKEQGTELKCNTLCVKSLFLHYNKSTIDEILEEKYRGHDISFWEDLQDLHDNDQYWCPTGLTKEGTERYKFLKINK